MNTINNHNTQQVSDGATGSQLPTLSSAAVFAPTGSTVAPTVPSCTAGFKQPIHALLNSSASTTRAVSITDAETLLVRCFNLLADTPRLIGRGFNIALRTFLLHHAFPGQLQLCSRFGPRSRLGDPVWARPRRRGFTRGFGKDTLYFMLIITVVTPAVAGKCPVSAAASVFDCNDDSSPPL